jgi:hypothetical protein
MQPIQYALQQGISKIRTDFIEKIEEYTGMELRYSSIRPTIFGSFDIRNLRFYKGETVVMSVSRARISFSFLELLKGKKTSVYSIQIDRPVINLDLERDREIFDFLSSLSGKSQNKDKEILNQITEFLPEKPDYRIRNCFLSLTSGVVTYQVQDMNINIQGENSCYLLDGKMGTEIKYTGLVNRAFIIRSGFSFNGEYYPNLQEGKIEAALSSLSGIEQIEKKGGVTFSQDTARPLFNVLPLSVFVNLKAGIFSVLPAKESNDIDYFLFYNMDSKSLSSGLNCSNFIPGKYITFPEQEKNNGHLGSMGITGSASFNYERDGGMVYSVMFSAGDLSENADFVEINASGTEKNIVIDKVNLSAFENSVISNLFHGRINFSGNIDFSPFRPSGTFVFDQFGLTGKKSIDAVLTVTNHDNEVQISSGNITVGRSLLNDLDIRLFTSERELSVSLFALFKDEGTVNLEAILNYSPMQLESSLAFDAVSLFDIAEMAGPFSHNIYIPSAADNYLKNSLIAAEIFFTTDFTHVVYNAPGFIIKRDDFTVMLSFSGTGQQFTLSECVLSNGDLSSDFKLSAQVNFSDPLDLNFSLIANYTDLAWHVEGQILDRSTLIIRDPNGLHAYGNLSNSGAISGYIECIEFPLLLSSSLMYLNSYITLRYDSKDFWALDIMHFSAHNINSNGLQESLLNDQKNGDFLQISGTADQDGANFRNILYRDNIGALSGNADFSWLNDFSYVDFNVNLTDGDNNGEKCFASGMLENNHFNINAEVSQMRLDRFIGKLNKTVINAGLNLSWDSFSSFSADLKLTSLQTNIRNEDFYASTDMKFTNDDFFINNLKTSFADVNVSLNNFHINRIDNFAKAAIEINGIVNERDINSKIEIDANFKHIDSWIDIKNAMEKINCFLKIEDIIYGDFKEDRTVFVLSKNEKELSVSGGPKNMLRLEMDSEGNFFAGLSAPFPVRGSIVGSYKDGVIDAHCPDFFMDMPALWAFVPPVREFEIAGGYITANLDIKGPLINPDYFGSGKGSSFRFRVPNYISQDIKPVPFNIAVQGSDMSFDSVQFTSSKGGGTVSGYLRFDRWIPENIGLEITIPRETPVPYKTNIKGFLTNGDASGNIYLLLNYKTLEMSADLYANNAELTMNIDEIRQRDRDAFSDILIPIVANLTITTGPVVEFTWPSTSPILRAFPEMGTVVTITVDSNNGQYSMNSDVKIRSGELYYLDRDFYIRQGNLVFRENEQKFDPRISARAEIRDRTDTGPVTISMIIENEPLLSFVPRFEAIPSLTQLEIFALLGQNIYNLPGNENQDLAQTFILSSAADLLTQFVSTNDVLAQLINTRQFERQIRNWLRLDMFNVRTRFLQNAFTNNVNVFGQTSVDRNSRVGNYFDNTTVFIGKYVGQDMFIQGMLSMRYDENNLSFGGLKFEPDIGIELNSPLFNIRWNFFPYHPENWWVNDNSITLTWSRSF